MIEQRLSDARKAMRAKPREETNWKCDVRAVFLAIS